MCVWGMSTATGTGDHLAGRQPHRGTGAHRLLHLPHASVCQGELICCDTVQVCIGLGKYINNDQIQVSTFMRLAYDTICEDELVILSCQIGLNIVDFSGAGIAQLVVCWARCPS